MTLTLRVMILMMVVLHGPAKGWSRPKLFNTGGKGGPSWPGTSSGEGPRSDETWRSASYSLPAQTGAI